MRSQTIEACHPRTNLVRQIQVSREEDVLPLDRARRELIGAALLDVRYAPNSDQVLYRSEMSRWAMSRHMQCDKQRLYSITSSAANRTD
jgi:hypothetical protein